MQAGKKTTIDAKGFFYFSNGTGRDTYVLKDNAGFTKPMYGNKAKDKFDQFHSFNFAVKQKPQYSLFEAKNNHYFSDGTGRDHYITSDEGGQISGTIARHNMTQKSFNLRNYEKYQNISANDFYLRSQKMYKTNAVTQQILSQRQQSLTGTLSQPKKIYKYGDSNKKLSLKHSPLEEGTIKQ